VNRAWEVWDDIGFWYSTASSSLYHEARLLTVMRRSKEKPPSEPRFFHRILPVGRAAPVVSVERVGIIWPECTASYASTHSMETAGLVMEEKSTVTAFFTQDGRCGG
jgi:hypothetical protein